MNYYLDTNVIYDLKKYPVSLLPFSFTSTLTVMELVTGIKDPSSYAYRKAALSQMVSKRLQVSWELPEKIIFESFDVFQGNEFDDQRPAALQALATALLTSVDYDSFMAAPAYQTEFGFAYFRDLDERLSKTFIAATKKGNDAFASALKADPTENSITHDGEVFTLDTPKSVNSFFDRFPEINMMLSVDALVNLARTWLPDQSFTDEQLFYSYNNQVAISVNAFSIYSLTKQTQKNLPGRNDGADLIHTFYLRNYANVKLVSDDKIFPTLMPELVLTLDDLWQKKSHLTTHFKGLQPVRVLESNVLHTFENTHPLFVADTLQLIKKLGLQPGITYYAYEQPLRYSTPDFKSQMPHVDSTKKIAIHETFISYLWIVSYTVLILLDEAVLKPIEQYHKGAGINVIDTQALTSAEALFAYGKSLIAIYDPWDKATLPNPEEYSLAEEFYVTRANALLTYALNFILCHEYAHVEKGHIDQIGYADDHKRKQFEREADDRAIELALKGRDGKNNKSIEMGILIGFCASLFSKPNASGGRHHPDKDERIKNYLNQLNPAAEDPIWGMATLFFKLWDQQFGLNLNWPTMVTDFKELFEIIIKQVPIQ